MLKGLLQSKFITLILIAGLGLVIIGTARILVQKQKIDREVARIENQMDKISKENEELNSLIQYLNTAEYKEKEAREKLNLSKEGEHVVVLPTSDEDTAGTTTVSEATTSNPKQWFNYFFNVE